MVYSPTTLLSSETQLYLGVPHGIGGIDCCTIGGITSHLFGRIGWFSVGDKDDSLLIADPPPPKKKKIVLSKIYASTFLF